MKAGKLLAIDLSTTCTGIAIFDIKSKKLIKHDYIKPRVAGLSKLKYPESALERIKDISNRVKNLVSELDPDIIVIEEVNLGISRVAQKSLNAVHYFVLDYLKMINPEFLNKIKYIDSNGKDGWRPGLGLKLSKEDKEFNKKVRKDNKNSKLKKEVINWKTLAQRYANSRFELSLDVSTNSEDSDMADAICLGIYFLDKLK